MRNLVKDLVSLEMLQFESKLEQPRYPATSTAVQFIKGSFC